MIKSKINFILPILIICFALSFRAYNFSHSPFDFDQVQIAKAADQILDGDLTLIGPRTGPAAMFTGPLIYYLTAGFGLFIPTHYALFATTFSISLATGFLLSLLALKYTSYYQAIVILSLWAFSPFLVFLDRIPWNPNLSFLATTLVFFPSLKFHKGLDWKDCLLVTFGVFLGYQAHFSGLLLLPIFLLAYLLFSPKWKFLPFILPTLGLLATLTPTVLFDFRHDWLNARGISQLVFNNQQVSSFSLLPRLIDKAQITIETLGAILFSRNSQALVLVTGIAVIATWLYSIITSQTNNYLKLISLWIIATVLSYSFYREATPEYYFLVLTPIFIFMISQVLTKLASHRLIIFILTFIGLQTAFLTWSSFYKSQGLNLKTQLAVIENVVTINQFEPLSEIIFEMEITRDLGLQYFLEKHELNLVDTGKKLRIIHPANSQTPASIRVTPDTVIWLDHRVNHEFKYYTFKKIVFSYSPTWQVYLIEDHWEKYEAELGLLVTNNNQDFLARFLVYERESDKSIYEDLWQSLHTQYPNPTPSNWNKLSFISPHDWVSFQDSKVLILTDTTDQFEPLPISLMKFN